MTTEMIQYFGSSNAAHSFFEDTNLELFAEAINNLVGDKSQINRTFNCVERGMNHNKPRQHRFETISELASLTDEEIYNLHIPDMGPSRLKIVNEALQLIVEWQRVGK